MSERTAARVTAALTLCLVTSLAPLMSFPAVLPQVSGAWQLSASEAGWIGGIYFAGYALAVPFLSGSTDRIDGRWVLAGSSLVGAAAGFAFAEWANGFLDGARAEIHRWHRFRRCSHARPHAAHAVCGRARPSAASVST